jgi:predicted lipid-binding transport protein (Tim44 family)
MQVPALLRSIPAHRAHHASAPRPPTAALRTQTKPPNPMASTSDSSNSNNNSAHESGALAAWGFIIGGLIGSVVGLFTGYWVLVGFIFGTLFYFAGALIERLRR